MSTATISPAGLPAKFADLDQFSEWIIEARIDRYHHRLDSTMDNMQAFYDACFPRIEELITYCDQYDVDDLPDDVKKLMWLIFSLVEVSFPIECWRQARVPDTGEATFWDHREPLL